MAAKTQTGQQSWTHNENIDDTFYNVSRLRLNGSARFTSFLQFLSKLVSRGINLLIRIKSQESSSGVKKLESRSTEHEDKFWLSSEHALTQMLEEINYYLGPFPDTQSLSAESFPDVSTNENSKLLGSSEEQK